MTSQFFKNARVYRIADVAPFMAGDLQKRLINLAFNQANNLEMQSIGWVPSYEGDPMMFRQVGDVMLLKLRTSKKLLPPKVVNEATKQRAADIEEAQGYKPGRKQMREIKEQVTDELLPKAFTVHSDTRVLALLDDKLLVVDASSDARADEAISMLAKTLDPLPLENLYVASSPSQAMTQWLVDGEAPGNFTIDQDGELRSSGESRAAIRYVRHSIAAEDAVKHIQQGKQCTRLALTWADRISFVLDEGLNLKRIKPLDILDEGREADQNEEERQDADLTLFAMEFAKLMADLIGALGGEKKA